ncbi:MAG: glycosyltransferase family 2 protein, partial [Anaerolineae bacterium]
MRVGKNPAKALKSAPQPARVTVAVITYIPVLSGYYAESLEVLKICLNSLWQNTREPYDLLLFDNASCAEVRGYLREQHEAGYIQYLVLSDKNIGKAGAWNFIFGAAPGEVIAYADSDVRFYPGWLRAHLDVLETFPNVGMVTGMPMWTPQEFSTATIEWAEANAEVKVLRGRYLSWEDYWRHARSLGAEEEKARVHYEANDVVCVEKDGRRYYIGAAHFQFVSPKAALQSVLPIPSRRPMGEVRLLDIAL